MSGPNAPTLRFLGAGAAFSRRYGTTCSLLVPPDGRRWLIDCGRQAPDQVFGAGLTWHQIHGQIITHVHGDHVFGLEDFAFNRFYTASDEVKPVMFGGTKPAFIAHSAVTVEVWETLAPSLRYLRRGDQMQAGTLGDYFAIVEPTGREPPDRHSWPAAERFVDGALDLVARENEHVPGKPSCALEIALEGGRIAWWSGDSIVEPERLAALAERATILFHDCTFVEYPGQVHGAFSLLRALPEPMRAKMVLMHHDDDIEAHRGQAEALGFRLGLPGDVYDLATGRRIARG